MSRHPGYVAIHALKANQIVDLEGLLFRKIEGEIEPGDTYIAARNTVDVFTCRFRDIGAVFPEGRGYPFDDHECVRVELIEDESASADYVVPNDCLTR